jgi:hypothetical protein
VAVFGIDRVDEPEQRWFVRSPLHRYLAVDLKNRGLAAAAQEVLETVHGSRHEFVVLLDLDVIASEEFGATNFPGSGGLSLEEVRQALSVFARQPTLAALVVAGYNPTRDTDAKAAKIVIDLLATVLSPRLQAPPAESAGASVENAASADVTPPAAPAKTTENLEPSADPVSAPVTAAAELPDLASPSSEGAPETPSDVVPESEPPTE